MPSELGKQSSIAKSVDMIKLVMEIEESKAGAHDGAINFVFRPEVENPTSVEETLEARLSVISGLKKPLSFERKEVK